ncbi:MAG: hypothetical protein WKF49_05410, partial [Thermoleophilaceae bacterium]
MIELVRDLSLALREQVLPQLGAHAGRTHEVDSEAAGGDVTFAIDAAAEAFLEEFLSERAPDVAFYSEDRGLVLPRGAPLGSPRGAAGAGPPRPGGGPPRRPPPARAGPAG